VGFVERVAVFIDWQNCYHCAREAFHDPNDPNSFGQLRPGALAQLLAEKGNSQRTVVRIGIYRGQPNPRIDPRTHAAHSRQMEAWKAECGSILVPRTRALRYLNGRPLSEAEEKGIDVQLAIDAMLMAVSGNCETVILATTDTDLLPVVEGIMTLKALRGSPSVEVIGWAGLDHALTAKDVPVRWIGPKDYAAVRDHTNYTISAGQRTLGLT
jgi:uncharacterized LabA/DUF88 family protein